MAGLSSRTGTCVMLHITPPSDAEQISAWSALDLHRSYLADEMRTRVYRAGLRAALAQGGRVLDLGSGTGILSMMAARCGADAVLGVDWSDLVAPARAAVRDNGLSKHVDFLNADLRTLRPEDHPLLGRRADVIVHDLIGGLMWDEDMIA